MASVSLGGDVLAWNLIWGFPEAQPAVGDFNGDGKADLGVYHEGEWYIRTLAGSVIAWKVF